MMQRMIQGKGYTPWKKIWEYQSKPKEDLKMKIFQKWEYPNSMQSQSQTVSVH